MEKKCTKCQKVKAIDQFGKHRGRKDGLNNQCRECVLLDSRRRKPLKRNPDILPEGKKRCSTCKSIKNLEEFGTSKNRTDGLNTRCKICARVSKQNSRKNDSNCKTKENVYKLLTIRQHIVYNCRGIDKRKNRICDIDVDYIEQLEKIQNGLNLYTNTPIKWDKQFGASKNTGHHRCSSIDRIDSSKGHIKGNVQIVELWVNRLKLHYDVKTFHKVLKQIKNPTKPTDEIIVFDNLPRFQKVFLWNKINNTKARQKKRTGDTQLGFNVYNLLEIWEVQGRRCAITNIPINIYPNNPFSISIDRIDSDNDYNIENIHLTAWVINSAKSDIKLKEFKIFLHDLKKSVY